MNMIVDRFLPLAAEAQTPGLAGFLQANSDAYEWLVANGRPGRTAVTNDDVLGWASAAARFAMVFHPGRFADGAIENRALEIGNGLRSAAAGQRSQRQRNEVTGGRRRVLHVATHVAGVGGHTRMLYHWVRSDLSSRHSILVTAQGSVPVPNWLAEAVPAGGGAMTVLPETMPMSHKAVMLRSLAMDQADLVVLHHNGCDPVPTAAFATADCPPVALLNLADHQFWLGSSVADLVVSLRTTGALHAEQRRYVPRGAVLPIPLGASGATWTRKSARQALGIPDHQVVLLSIGRGEKYRPCGPYDFVATTNKILAREQSARAYVVGDTAAGIAPHLRCKPHDRLHFVGSLDDPSRYRAAADVYLESFPFGSNTALLEAAACGLPVVPAYAPLFQLLVAGNDSLDGALPNPATEEEYVERVRTLIRLPALRYEFGESLRRKVLGQHVGAGWLEHLASLYERTDRLTHAPRSIPSSACCLTTADVSLSLWHIMPDGTIPSGDSDPLMATAVLRHKAYVSRYVGDFATAWWCSLAVLVRKPLEIDTWKQLAAAVLSPLARPIRKLFARPK